MAHRVSGLVVSYMAQFCVSPTLDDQQGAEKRNLIFKAEFKITVDRGKLSLYWATSELASQILLESKLDPKTSATSYWRFDFNSGM